MPFYIEGALWYLVLLDAIIYNIMAWTKGKKHDKIYHWVSQHFPLNRFMGFVYFILVLWVGYTLFRMQIILFK